MSNETLTINEKKFALKFVETGGQLKASYMYAYSCAGLSDQVVMQRAIKAFAKREVKEYIRELRTDISASAIFDVQAMVNDLVMVISANPAELIAWHVGACRHCYGKDHRYQWIDEYEEGYGDALAKCISVAIDKDAPMPAFADGGLGYDHSKQPSKKCPHCRGTGVGQASITDTRKLSPAAMRLYQGIKIGSNGQLEVKMRNQDEAFKMLMRIYGVYNPAAMVAPPKLAKDAIKTTAVVEPINLPQDPQKAADYYQNWLNGKTETQH